ncbi:type II/IV secretion system protein [bacterium]|nr:MAG: type II/IV secretion system protein [bacterium]
MISLAPEKLKEILVKAGTISSDAFDKFKEEGEHKRQNVAELIISQGLINKDYLYLLISKALGVERVNLGSVGIDKKVLHELPEDIARQRNVIVFGRDPKGFFYVAMEDPTNLETIDFLNLRLGGQIKPFLASEEDLSRGFLLYQQQLTQDFKEIIEDSIRESLRSKTRGDVDLKEAAADLPIVAIVDNLVSYASSSRASDIHFEVLDDVILVRFRIDGILHEIIRVPKEIHPAIVARVKILSSLRVDEHTHPQDGRFRYDVGGGGVVDIRVSIIPTFYGEKIEMRLLSAAQKPLSFSELGMFEDTVKLVHEAVSKTYGMVLVCGPTGSGKSTTLYSFMDILNQPEVNIVTVEDPIEYDMRYLNQMQVNAAAGITFASGLRSILRQDPNIIMVGEIRDAETADISVQAALTGHLVLSSLHTNDAATAVPRLLDMGVPQFLVSAVVNAVCSQRLARRIHLDCIESYSPPKEILAGISHQLEELNVNKISIRLPKTFYRGKGCDACGHTGYQGRLGIFEVLNVSENVRKLIISPQFSLDSLRLLAKSEGMVTMLEDGLKKVELGMTTIEEIFRVIRE